MCDPVTIAVVTGATLSAAGGVTSAVSSYRQGAAMDKYYNSLADQRVQEGQAAIDQAQRQSEVIQDTAKVEGKKLKTDQARFNSSVRAQLAAQGITGVTAEDIVTGNLTNERMDEILLRRNADVKSWEARTQGNYANWQAQNEATQLRFVGKQEKRAGKMKMYSTLLSTAGSTASTLAGSGIFKGKTPASTTT